MDSDPAAYHPENSTSKGLTTRQILLVLIIAFAGGVIGGAISGGVTININDLSTYGVNPIEENLDSDD